MGRTGTASLPLHGGHVPRWLSSRMERLGRVITEAIVHHYGQEEFLRRIAHPFWFQSFGAVMGMDWHSSGITTSVLGALKRGLDPISSELGIYVCGGRGNASRQTPSELLAVGDRTGLDGNALARASRLVAKVDSAAVQDGFSLYLHGFVVSRSGAWTVVQQGMSPSEKLARRYHWISEGLSSFVDEPHAAIEGPMQPGLLLNMTDARASESRSAQLSLIETPDKVLDHLREKSDALVLPHLDLPAHHDVRRDDVSMRRLGATLLAASERGPKDYAELLLTPGLGARTIFALAHVAEVVHGTPSRFSDPARFSLAHGGKDGHPFPVPLKVYDETIRVMKDAITRAKLGDADRVSALKALDDRARTLEHAVEDVDFDAFVNQERRDSRAYGGRTVFDDAKERKKKPERDRKQLGLFRR